MGSSRHLQYQETLVGAQLCQVPYFEFMESYSN